MTQNIDHSPFSWTDPSMTILAHICVSPPYTKCQIYPGTKKESITEDIGTYKSHIGA